jgi:hypothetical protein
MLHSLSDSILVFVTLALSWAGGIILGTWLCAWADRRRRALLQAMSPHDRLHIRRCW